MTTNIIQMRGAKEAPKADRSRMETLLLTPEIVAQWRLPPFQRPLRVNHKVMAISEDLKLNGGIVEGVISLGTIGADKTHYLYDGQHRIEAAKLSGLQEFIADVRICRFESMTDMGVEFVNLNTAIVRLCPDDVLRGLEGHVPALGSIRKACGFIGYENIRRNTASPTLSMAAALKCWYCSAQETPAHAGKGAAVVASEMTADDTEILIRFLNLARAAWGGDLEYARLWGNLNLTLCMWLYRRLVLDRQRGAKRFAVLNPDQFKKCLMSLSAAPDYIDWLVGRALRESDRSPCFNRMKSAFVARLRAEKLSNTMLPSPAWAAK